MSNVKKYHKERLLDIGAKKIQFSGIVLTLMITICSIVLAYLFLKLSEKSKMLKFLV